MEPRNCQNCKAPLANRRPTATHCMKRECQLARQKAQRLSRLVMVHCRNCGDPIGYGHKAWCDKPECQAAKKEAQANRRRERVASDRAGKARTRRAWGKSSSKEPTGRECQKCGKEIFRIIGKSGLVTFDSFFHCRECPWPAEDEVINEEFAYS